MLLIGWVFRRATLSEAAAELAAAPPWLWVAVPGLFLLNSLVYTGRVVVLLPRRPPVLASLRAVLVANFAGLALPTGGGEAAKVVTLGPVVGGSDRALAAVVVARLIELVVWGGLVLWAAAGVLPGRHEAMVPLAWAVGLAFVGIAALGLGLVPVPTRLLGRLPGRVGFFLERSGKAMTELRRRPTALLQSLGLALAFAAINVLTAWLVLRAYGLDISYVQVLGLVPTMDVAISLPISISGVGVRESVFVTTLAAWGAEPSTSVAMAFTRWVGHLSRGLVGGVLFAIGGGESAAPGR